MKNVFIPIFATFPLIASGQIGIGTSNPEASLHVENGSALFNSPGAAASISWNYSFGEGRRILWDAERAAFRAGAVLGSGSTFWDSQNIGRFSFAAGYNSRATGENTVALGAGAQAGGDDAVALGQAAVALGTGAVAIGGSIAPSARAVAIGSENRAGASFSLALGKNARVSHAGAAVLSDASASIPADSAFSSAANQMTMRYSGGFRLFTNVDFTGGVSLAAGAGSWATVSDKRKKENFKPIDTESILQKVAALPLTEWNYKSQDATIRHIGPMAQDFHKAFALDGAANDTTINTIDIDGINMAAIQALEKRTQDLQKENHQLRAALEAMEQRTAALEKVIHGNTAGIAASR